MMFRQHFWHGNGVVRGTAISGIDIALWDIVGKLHGVPCHKLWGGPVRDYIRTYCHLGGGRMEDMYEAAPGDARRFADLAARAVDEGFTAMKTMGVPETVPARRSAPDSLCRGVCPRHARSGRRRHRPDGRLPRPPFAAHGLAIRQGLEPYDLYWLEEPCWPEAPAAMADIQHAVRTPIATGERLIGIHAFREFFEQRAFSVAQPDITHTGGCPKRGGSRPWPRRTASRSLRTIRRDQSARPRRWSSASPRPATSSANRCISMCPGGRMW